MLSSSTLTAYSLVTGGVSSAASKVVPVSVGVLSFLVLLAGLLTGLSVAMLIYLRSRRNRKNRYTLYVLMDTCYIESHAWTWAGPCCHWYNTMFLIYCRVYSEMNNYYPGYPHYPGYIDVSLIVIRIKYINLIFIMLNYLIIAEDRWEL